MTFFLIVLSVVFGAFIVLLISWYDDLENKMLFLAKEQIRFQRDMARCIAELNKRMPENCSEKVEGDKGVPNEKSVGRTH